ncbi:Crp/Fnr family transcriptional regulator [Hujiaoplasma nucleasis]|uniref:Crp/Fnr family transcriptional regulator n=1 Tax=Hujiaoplasma nucleasis TaxID=2725268 RepID=A0A7L6N1N0_9MOLU|nr:Crp/Fnr family transcriptional regulator [Hujiaoplasma nucleasis]QLY39481.1 Crp/Fnr family transcriptional regulator [Hujiaoplasma nucleasis]
MKKNCANCIYGNIHSQEIVLEDKAILFLEGQSLKHVYSINQGYIKMSKYTENGDEYIIGVLGPGDYIALLALLQNKETYIASATALSKVELRSMEKNEVLKAYQSNQKFKEMCLNCAITRSNLFHNQLSISANTDIKEKIILILSNLANKFGYINNKKMYIDLPFSKTVLANIINVRRETLSRYLSVLQNEKILSVNKNQYILHYVI